MSSDLFLGIDTSNYTTSVGIVDGDGKLVANVKRPLPVSDGACGLRQSDAVFAHVKNLPSAMSEIGEILCNAKITAVGVSETPRRESGSYMPCFLVGVATAEVVCKTQNIPLYRFSHQCGHIMAAVYSSGRFDLLEKTFPAYHVSGGTTELLRVCRDGSGFRADVMGGTLDLHAGQVVDRIGVYMGLSFPAGPVMEKLALENKTKIPRAKLSVKGLYANFSGIENLSKKLYDETQDKALTSAFVFSTIADILCVLTKNYIREYGESPVLFAGGVMSNSLIKNRLKEDFDASFAEPRLSSDNAVGIAVLAKRAYQSEK